MRKPVAITLIGLGLQLVAVGASRGAINVAQRALGSRAPVAMFRANPQHTRTYDTKGVRQFGALLWKFKAGLAVQSSPAIANGVVYFGSNDKYLYALEARTGQEKWRFAAQDTPWSPSVANGVV